MSNANGLIDVSVFMGSHGKFSCDPGRPTLYNYCGSGRASAQHALDALVPGRHAGARQEESGQAWQEESAQTLCQWPRLGAVMALIADSSLFHFICKRLLMHTVSAGLAASVLLAPPTPQMIGRARPNLAVTTWVHGLRTQPRPALTLFARRSLGPSALGLDLLCL